MLDPDRPRRAIGLRAEHPDIAAQLHVSMRHAETCQDRARAVGRTEGYCNACFTGLYPIEIDFGHTKTGFEKSIN